MQLTHSTHTRGPAGLDSQRNHKQKHTLEQEKGRGDAPTHTELSLRAGRGPLSPPPCRGFAGWGQPVSLRPPFGLPSGPDARMLPLAPEAWLPFAGEPGHWTPAAPGLEASGCPSNPPGCA